MGSGLHTTDDEMMRANQRRDVTSEAEGASRQPTAVGGHAAPPPEAGSAPDDGPRERLVQPGTGTPSRGLGNIINGHNRPADNAPKAAIAKADRAPS